jgi:hypothetical protein
MQIESTATVDNQTKKPEKFVIFGTASSNSYIKRDTGSSLYCVTYLPKGNLTVSGPSVASAPDIFGAFSSMNLTFSNSPNLHYDTSLRTATFSGIDAPFTVSNWRELTDPAEKIVLP